MCVLNELAVSLMYYFRPSADRVFVDHVAYGALASHRALLGNPAVTVFLHWTL